VPQTCLERGTPEYLFARAIEQQLAQQGTIGVGYNSIRFDDEVTRFLFWRNLMDPYGREWQNECGRWDLLDVVRCAFALRPAGIVWPTHADGKPSFKLEHLSAANDIAHIGAHDALSDVRATIALARLVKARQPRLWDFCLRLRSKHEVIREMAYAQAQGMPFLHVSSMYGTQRGCIAPVWPLAPHPTNKNEVIVWDLSVDPSELFTLNVQDIRTRMFTRSDELPAGVSRLPITTIQLNKSPVVIGNLKTLGEDMATKWGLDMVQALVHAQDIAKRAPLLSGMWAAVFERPARAQALDVDEDLYAGFISNEDRRTLEGLGALDGVQLATTTVSFSDSRLNELVFRYRARNFPAFLSATEKVRWQQHCALRLHDGVGGALTLSAYLEQIDTLEEDADDRGQAILGALVDYATQIAPEQA
jgi:exodeoxyribonuclease I